MRAFLFLFALLLTSVGVSAQGDSPGTLVGLLEAGDFRALTVTDDGEYLLVTDAATSQIRIYALNNLAEPPLIASVAVDGVPTGIAAGRGFVLVATRSSASPSTIEVLAPARYASDSPFAAGSNYVDLPFETDSLIVSAERNYAAALGQDRFALLRLRSAGDIDARTFNRSISAAAIASGTLFYAEGSILHAARLNGTSIAADSGTLDAGGAVTGVAISSDGSVGALARSDGEIRFFDPNDLDLLGSTSSGVRPVIIQFGAAEGRLRLLVAGQGENRLRVIDAEQPDAPRSLDADLRLDGSIVGLTTFPDHVVATDGSTIGIFALP